jgi:hypothetical protein
MTPSRILLPAVPARHSRYCIAFRQDSVLFIDLCIRDVWCFPAVHRRPAPAAGRRIRRRTVLRTLKITLAMGD